MKKIVSLLLSAVMVISLCVPAFAAEEKLNFLSLGDSIAAGAGLMNPSKQAYGAIVSSTNGYSFKNDAISGHTTQNMIKRINEKRVSSDIEKADIICVSIGGNNFLTDNMAGLIADAIERNDYTRFDEIASKFYDDIGVIVNRIKTLNPDVTLIFQTLYNPMYVSVELREVYQQGADRVNGTIRRYLADNEGAYTISEVAAAFGDDESLINADYIHPNSKGHIVIAREVLKTLKELGLGEKTEPEYKQSKLSTFFDELLYKIRRIFEKITAFFGKDR